MTQEKIKRILNSMESLEELLLSVPDDLLLQIDPRDNESLKKGYELISSYNEVMDRFTEVSSEIRNKIMKYYSMQSDEDDSEAVEMPEETQNTKEKIIREPDQEEPHYVSENFTYKRPYGFVLRDAAFKNLITWKKLYIQFLKELSRINPELFLSLPENEKFISSRGFPVFAREKSKLRNAVKRGLPFYAETNLSANGFVKNIKELLEYFGIEENQMKIYLREDRNAES